MRIALIGDLSGTAEPATALEHAAEVVAHRVDPDAWDDLVGRLAPRIRLGFPWMDRVELREGEDLHPDGLVRGQPALAELLRARAAAAEPEAMARHLRAAGVPELAREPAAPEPAPAAEDVSAPEAAPSLVDELLEGARRRPADRPRDDFERLIQAIVERSGDDIDHAAVERRRAAIDAELARRVCAIYAHPRFQSVEASWRVLYALAEEALSSEVELLALDLPVGVWAEECAAAGGKVEETVAYRLAVSQLRDVHGGEGVSLFVVPHDVTLARAERELGLLCAFARAARAPLVAGAAPSLAGDGGERLRPGVDGWDAWRHLPGAERVALVFPRLLCRPSWTAAEEPVELVSFDEERPPPLFASGAAALATAAVRAAASGDLARTIRHVRLEGLPIEALHTPEGHRQIGPTERPLTEREIEELRAAGFVPLASLAGSDEAELMSLRSIAGSPLFGAGGPA